MKANQKYKTIISPYRICPLGAHSDHQGGPTLGIPLNLHTTLRYYPTDDSVVEITSANFPGTARIDLNDPKLSEANWSRYCSAAILSLREKLPTNPKGIVGHITGAAPGNGLSSSASVLLAYVKALASTNDLELSQNELVDVALRAEQKHIRINVGILDFATIVGGKRDHLLAIDGRNQNWQPIPQSEHAPPYEILVAFSSTTRNLSNTPYNSRVNECFQAAQTLAELSGFPETKRLHDLPDHVFERYEHKLTEVQAKRARHFFTERKRVYEGIEMWKRGDLKQFGKLMNRSCESSIENWEAGSDEIIAIQNALLGAPGVFGSRFSGAGFGGCVIALVQKVDAIAHHIPGKVLRATSDEGLREL